MFFQIISIVFPVFFLVFIGWILGFYKWISYENLQDTNKIIFYIAIPCLLFRSLIVHDATIVAVPKLFFTYYIGVTIIYSLAFLVGYRFFHLTIQQSAVMAMASSFSNNLMIAFPILHLTWGEEATVRLFALLTIHAVFLWTLTLILIEVGTSRSETKKSWFQNIIPVLRDLLKNPIIIALLFGMLWRWTGYGLLHMVDRFLSLVGQMAVPLALLVLGLGLNQFSINENKIEPLWIAFVKSILMPICIYILGRFIFKLDDIGVYVTTIMAAASVGINPYILAQRYNIYQQRVATSFLISIVFTIFVYIFWLYMFLQGVL